jgi:hypothetical protein
MKNRFLNTLLSDLTENDSQLGSFVNKQKVAAVLRCW